MRLIHYHNMNEINEIMLDTVLTLTLHISGITWIPLP